MHLTTEADRQNWIAVHDENEYCLPILRPHDVVIDIGANIGSFAALAWEMGSRHVWAYEIDFRHYATAVRNLREYAITWHYGAVVRSDEYRADPVFYDGSMTAFAQKGEKVPTFPLDQILEQHDEVRFVKIDCEGSEWPILYTAKELHRVRELAGEYHTANAYPDLPEDIGPCTPQALEEFLQDQGFQTDFMPEPAGGCGNFWAKRP